MISKEQKEIYRPVDIHVLESLVTTGCNNIPSGIKKAVLVIGDTGSGKSTLINALTDKKLIAVENDDDLDGSIIIRSAQNDGPKIGDTSVSETTVPQIWKDKDGVMYFDCPGFEDTKGAEQDIANGVFVNKLFKSIDEVKIVLVVSQKQFTSDRAKDTIKLIKKLTSMFPDQKQISTSVSLILSKASKTVTPEKIKANMLKIIGEHKDDNSSTTFFEPLDGKEKLKNKVGLGEEKKLNSVGEMWNLISHGNISIFKSPEKTGVYTIDSAVSESIRKANYTKKPDVNIAISDSSRVLIRNAYDYLLKTVEQRIKNIGKDIEEFELKNSAKHTDKGDSSFEDSRELMSKMMKIKTVLSSVNNDRVKHLIDKHDMSEFSSKLVELHQILQIKQDSISPLVEMFSLLKRVVGDGINQEVSDCIKGFSDLDAKIVKKVIQSTNDLKNQIASNSQGIVEHSYEEIIKMSNSDKQKLKSKIQSLNKFRDLDYIEKAAKTIYDFVPNDQNKGCMDAILQTIVLIKEINKTLDGEKIAVSSSDMQAGISSIMNGMLLSEQEIEERKVKIEKAKNQIIDCYEGDKINEASEPNTFKITGNNVVINDEYTNKITDFHKAIQSENTYLNHGKYLVIFATSTIQFDSNVKIDGCNLFVCAPQIKFSPNVEFNLFGKNGVSYSDRASNGYWDSNDELRHWKVYVNPENIPGGTNGAPGKNGEPGFPGGSVVMLAYSYKGLKTLKVNVSGGNGGDGQSGGHGGSCNESYLTAPKSRAGGDGGDGGDSALGGKHGLVCAMEYNKGKVVDKSNEANLVNLDGNNGNPGQKGSGGKGWKGNIATSGNDGSDGNDGKLSDETKNIIYSDFICESKLKELYRDFVANSPDLGPDTETLGDLNFIPFFDQ